MNCLGLHRFCPTNPPGPNTREAPCVDGPRLARDFLTRATEIASSHVGMDGPTSLAWPPGHKIGCRFGQQEVDMTITVIGLDLAKNVFQVHGIDEHGRAVLRRKIRRSDVLPLFSKLTPALVGMEACHTSHYWAREIAKFGHDVRMMPAQFVKPYVNSQKNDAADAEAICEAVQRPTMRFVPVKSENQQAALMLHRTRDLLVRQRSSLISSIRAHFAEFGIVVGQGIRM